MLKGIGVDQKPPAKAKQAAAVAGDRFEGRIYAMPDEMASGRG